MLTDKEIALRILATGVVLALGASALLLSGCAYPPKSVVIIPAGSTLCNAPSVGECKRLSKIGETLNTGPLAEAIEQARMK